MSFSKAKLSRFNEKPLGCGPDAVYETADQAKPIGGLIDTKIPRFQEHIIPGTPSSDAGSVHSTRSAGCFRSPAIRKLRGLTKVNPLKLNKTLIEHNEIIEAKSIEILNKDETIAENERQIEELNSKIRRYEEELAKFNLTLDEQTEKSGEMKTLSEMVNEYEHNLEKGKSTTCELNLIIDEKESIITQLATEKISIEMERDDSKQEKVELQADLEMLKQSLSEKLQLENQVRSLKSDCELLKQTAINDNAAFVSKIKEMEDIKDELVKENKYLKNQSETDMLAYVEEVEKARSEVVKLNALKEQLESELSSEKGIISRLQEQLSNRLAEIASLKKVCTENEEIFQTTIGNMQKKMELDTAKHQSLVTSFEEIRQANEMLIIKQKEELSSLCARIEELQRENTLALQRQQKLAEEHKSEVQLLMIKHTDDLEEVKIDMTRKTELLQEMQDMKIKELESIMLVEKAKITSDCAHKISLVESNFLAEIQHAHETANEKLRIAEILAEEKCKAIESSFEATLAKEKAKWQDDFEKCQKIAETEIMNSEFEKNDLQSLLNVANLNIQVLTEENEKLKGQTAKQSEEILTLGQNLGEVTTNFSKATEDHANILKEIKSEYDRISSEKFKYEEILKNTHSTVDILSKRLKHSDKDVETLTEELELITKQKLDLENENIILKDAVEVLRDEYKHAMKNITESSKRLTEANAQVLKQSDDLLNTITKMETEVQQKVSDVENELVKKIETIQLEAAQHQMAKEKMELNLKEAREQLDEMFVTVAETSKVLRESEIMIQTKDDELHEIALVKEELTGQLYENNKLLNKLNDLVKTLKLKIQELSDRNENLKLEKLEENEKLIEIFSNKIKTLEFENDRLDNELKKRLQNTSEQENLKKESDVYIETIARLENDLTTLKQRCHAQEGTIETLESKVACMQSLVGPFRKQLEAYEAENKLLQTRNHTTLAEANAMGIKYAEMMGHQNHKQKIKHLISLKEHNSELKLENEKLQLANVKQKGVIDTQNALIRTLKEDQSRTPKRSNRSKLNVAVGSDKENINSPGKVKCSSTGLSASPLAASTPALKDKSNYN